MSENARNQVWDEEPAYLDWDALKGALSLGQSGRVLVFDAQSGDWHWAPRPAAPLAAEKEPAPHESDLKGSVADFLRSGLRNIDADRVNPANQDDAWRKGYQAASKQLSRDLCRHLDIAWDDKAGEPKKGA